MKIVAHIISLVIFAVRSLKDYITFMMWMKGKNISFCRQSKTKKRYLDSHILLGYSLLGRYLMQRIRKIHRGLSTELVKNKRKLRAYAIYMDLSGLTKNRCIHKYHFRKRQLANTLKVCIPTLEKWVNELIRLEWAWLDKGDLRFLGRRKFAQLFEKSANKAYYKIPTKNFKHIELHLRGLSIEENRQRQNYKLNEKVIKLEVKSANVKCEKIKEKFEKSLNVHRLKNKLSAVNILTPLNKEITLSRQGVAKVFKLKTAKSGTYWAKKLRVSGIIKDETQKLLCLGRMAKDYFRELQLKSKRYLFYRNGKAYCRLPNYLTYSLASVT